MARSGMANLLLELRAMINAGTADYTVGGVTSYFTDDQLENELDRTQKIQYSRPLDIIAKPVSGGSVQYLDYGIPEKLWLEETTGGTAIFVVRDSTGAVVSSGYTANYEAKLITFDSDTQGTAYYLDYRAYDLNRTAAKLWRWKAAHVADRVDWQSDNHRISASQEMRMCMEMARQYESMAGARSVKVIRSDVR